MFKINEKFRNKRLTECVCPVAIPICVTKFSLAAISSSIFARFKRQNIMELSFDPDANKSKVKKRFLPSSSPRPILYFIKIINYNCPNLRSQPRE